MWTRGQGETVDACGDAGSFMRDLNLTRSATRVKIERAVRASSFPYRLGPRGSGVRLRPGARLPRPGRRHGLGLISRQQREDRLRVDRPECLQGGSHGDEHPGGRPAQGARAGAPRLPASLGRQTRNAPFRLRVTRRMAAESPSRRPGSAPPSAHSHPDRDLAPWRRTVPASRSTPPPGGTGRSAWSPTGDGLLVQGELGTERTSGGSGIFLASLDGTELSPLTPAGIAMPDWASTGEVAFTAPNDPPCYPLCSNIYVMRLGGVPRRLTRRGGYSPSWSPHATKLAFVRADRGRRDVYRQDIYIVGRDGRGLRRLTRRGGASPSWSPDGKWIAFLRYGDMYVVRGTGGGLRRVVNAPSGPHSIDGPTVTSLDWQPLPRR